MRRAQHELPGALVVEVDEARIRVEGVRHLGRDLGEHLLEIEGRIDGLDRLGEQAQMPFAGVHPRRSVRREVRPPAASREARSAAARLVRRRTAGSDGSRPGGPTSRRGPGGARRARRPRHRRGK